MKSARPLEERFWEKVEKTDTCWLWTAYTNPAGYGLFRVRKPGEPSRMRPAHRVSYEISTGPIPEGHDIDHLCCVRSCVNPSHLEAVTHAENMQRSSLNVIVTGVCRSGRHEIHSEEDLYLSRFGRTCKECDKERSRNYQRNKRADRPRHID